jgi:hypothetical protein
MFAKLFSLNYPVRESEEESWIRFEELYRLTAEIAVSYHTVPQRDSSLMDCWKNLALFWGCHSIEVNGANLFREVMYHICFRKFSDRVEEPLLRLILLIEDEVLAFSFAFKAWVQTDVFREAYDEITGPYWYNPIFKKKYDGDMYTYLMYRVVKLVMIKNLTRDEWYNLFPMSDNLYPFRAYEVYQNVDEYEEAVKFLIPAAHVWYEEWSDRSVIIEQLQQLYGLDFSNDIKGLYSLINATKHRQDIDTCSWYLYRTKECSMVLLQHLWGSNYPEKLQRGFLSLCKRYKSAKRRNPARGRYGHSDFMRHWIYQQINAWRCDKTVDISKKVRDKLFEVGIGI